jgi:hypothetical protein
MLRHGTHFAIGRDMADHPTVPHVTTVQAVVAAMFFVFVHHVSAVMTRPHSVAAGGVILIRDVTVLALLRSFIINDRVGVRRRRIFRVIRLRGENGVDNG